MKKVCGYSRRHLESVSRFRQQVQAYASKKEKQNVITFVYQFMHNKFTIVQGRSFVCDFRTENS